MSVIDWELDSWVLLIMCVLFAGVIGYSTGTSDIDDMRKIVEEANKKSNCEDHIYSAGAWVQNSKGTWVCAKVIN